jgi:hypothetical protein
MTNYSAQQTVISASREELIEIFRWVHAREKSEARPGGQPALAEAAHERASGGQGIVT